MSYRKWGFALSIALIVFGALLPTVPSLATNEGNRPVANNSAALSAGGFHQAISSFDDDWNYLGQRWEPPDNAIAAGNGFILHVVNKLLYVYSPGGGNPLLRTSLAYYTGVWQRTTTVFDPAVFYDGMTAYGGYTNPSNQFFGVFQSNDEHGAGSSDIYYWMTPNYPNAGDPVHSQPIVCHIATSILGEGYDRPRLAVTADKIIVVWDEINTGQEDVWVRGKAEALQDTNPNPNCSSNSRLTQPQGPRNYYIGSYPVQDYSGDEAAYIVTNLRPFANLPVISIITVQGTPNYNWSFSGGRGVQIQSSSSPKGTGHFVHQRTNSSGVGLLASGDDVIISAVAVSGNIWTAISDVSTTSNPAVVAPHVSVFSKSGSTLLYDQKLNFSPFDVSFLALAPSFAGATGMIATASKSDTNPATAYGEIDPTTWYVTASTYASGPEPYQASSCRGVFGYGCWGDYSAIAGDPTVNGQFWSSAEFSNVDDVGQHMNWANFGLEFTR